MIPIVVCSIGSPSLQVLEASVKAYAPEHPLIVHHVKPSSFGESYNMAMEEAFKTYDEVVIANDDIVLNPDTMKNLLSDVEKLKQSDEVKDKIGLVTVLSDEVRAGQNIRFRFMPDDQIVGGKWQSERVIRHVPAVSPIMTWYSKKNFERFKFPPTNWWSDDILCEDMLRAGLMHFISTAYVHHVGSLSTGRDYKKLCMEAVPWILQNRPEYFEMCIERTGLNPKEVLQEYENDRLQLSTV